MDYYLLGKLPEVNAAPLDPIAKPLGAIGASLIGSAVIKPGAIPEEELHD
jgi:hypothetical protein